MHIQSKSGSNLQIHDKVVIKGGVHRGQRACIINKSENALQIILMDGEALNVNAEEVSIWNEGLGTDRSQQPPLPSAGVHVPGKSKIPMPLFEGPVRDEKPIPERESNILCYAFPKLFQTGVGDIYAPRLRSLDEGGQDALKVFINHCLHWHDNRFAKHPRFLYVLYNRLLRMKLLQTKSFYMKKRNPTPTDFLPENRKKTIKEMRAYTAKLPTTPGFKMERRHELENMCEQIKYMTANKDRSERLVVQDEYEDYSSSDEEDDVGGPPRPPSFWNTSQVTRKRSNEPEQGDTTVNISDHPVEDDSGGRKQRPIEGRIPCYWATLTTAPFRSSLFPYHINGHHGTEKDVKTRRKLAIENPNVVAFFAALQLELVLKYVMVSMLQLNDFYCVHEWGTGGVLHLHCILWNFDSEYLEDFDIQKAAVKYRISKRVIQKIAFFFNVHVSEYNLGKNKDGSWMNIPSYDDDLPHPASASKQEIDEVCRIPQNDDKETAQHRISFLVKLLEAVQQHDIHKPDPLGPPLQNQKCAKEKPQKNTSKIDPCRSTKGKYYCNKGFPKDEISFGDEEIRQDEFREKLWKLHLERNDNTLNNYNAIISLSLLANMDIQPVVTYDALLAYTTKYVTKDDNPDLFRDFRDDTGRPVDPVNETHRSEIPLQCPNLSKQVAKMFNEQIKYSMVSSPELHHHLLNLPTHYTSRHFLNISLQSTLKKLLNANDLCLNDPSKDVHPKVTRDDEVSIYEKRGTYEISKSSSAQGITLTTIMEMSLFLFYKHFFVRSNVLCRKTIPPIISFKPYISPKEKNNLNFEQYMQMTLLAYMPFTRKEEIISLNAEELKKKFGSFLFGGECPNFVIKAYRKANAKKKKTKKSNSSQDEIEKEALDSSADGDSDSEDEEFFRDSTVNENEQQNRGHEESKICSPPIAKFAKFSEAYQEYGHMAPKGLDYEGSDIAAFDDDNDVIEEIRILSDQQDIVHDHSKVNWKPKHPELYDQCKQAERTLAEKVGIQETSSKLDPSQLDSTQKLFLDTILDWGKQCIVCKKTSKPFPPLKIKLLGVAGTGKSRTIKTMLQEWDKLMDSSDLSSEKKGKIIMAAPTGVAAFNIGCGAASVHRTFNIPVRGKFQDLTGDAQEKLESTFANVWLIIIDEISMVGCEQFSKVNERLIQAKLDENYEIAKIQKNNSLLRPSFGGIGMIICGDFAQLVPIMQHSLMDQSRLPIYDTSKEKDRFTNKGKTLMEEFKVSVILTKQHRQTGGEYSSLCLKFRDGSFTSEDHLLLQTRNYDQLPLAEKMRLEEKGTRLVTTNQQAGKYNANKLLKLAKQKQEKILRFNAHETGNNSKAVTTSENFGGLKSTIHLTIGSRVMLTSNIWVEAGLINGAQGVLRDIVFHELEENDDEPSPYYALVELDDYKGPSLFEDENKNKWVPIFPVTRKHQFNPKIQREQLPLRLSSAMTGHKVQGLSLYEGVVVQYPSLAESKKDPMDTWGLNYCILTRVPSIDKISFINLPDYRRHMKLYTREKGKDFFQMFTRFDHKCKKEFNNIVQTTANISVCTLSLAEITVPIKSPIDFHSLFGGDRTEQSSHEQGSISQIQPPPHAKREQPRKLAMPSIHEKNPKPSRPTTRTDPSSTSTADNPFSHVVMMTPHFDNPSNNCWLNSILQTIIHALKLKGESSNNMEIPLRGELAAYGEIISTEIQKFLQPGSYSVNNILSEPQGVSLKQLVLFTMDINNRAELHKQHDAAQGLQAILGVTPSLSFLWHLTVETVTCETCNSVSSRTFPSSVASVDIAMSIKRNKFDAASAIKSYFETEETGIERRCLNCHGTTCAKSLMIPTPAKFIVVQFKRFRATRFRQTTTMQKINAEAQPFLSLEIYSGQGYCTYEVVATVQHLGSDLVQGHYIAYIKHQNNWLLCNDNRITPLGDGCGDPIRNSYLLILKFVDE